MFNFFKKKKSKASAQETVDTPALSDAKQQLLLQMRQKRAEIGEEELEKIAHIMKMNALKKQIKHDIEHDEDKRNRLLDEIRGDLKS